jgi:hypothetical protein
MDREDCEGRGIKAFFVTPSSGIISVPGTGSTSMGEAMLDAMVFKRSRWLKSNFAINARHAHRF